MHWEASAGALVVGLTGDRGSMAPSLSSEASGHLMRHTLRFRPSWFQRSEGC